jgi:glycosyltransferase involved in cell wall biosynthesis
LATDSPRVAEPAASPARASTPHELRRVGFNLLYLVPGEVGGSEVYARNLLGAIRGLEPELELTVYVGPEALETLRQESWAEGQTFVTSPVRSRIKPLRVASELTWLPRRAKRDEVQVLHSLGTTSPPFCGVPTVVSVLDLIYHHFPETFPAASRAGLRLLVPAGARRAARVIAISHAGKQDLVETLGLDPDRIDVVHLGFGAGQHPDPTPEAELRERYRLGDAPIVLAVAAALRHKNLGRLIDAFAALARERSAALVCVGHAGLEQQALRERAQAHGLGERMCFTGWIEDRDLEGFYAAARLFIHPNLFDGWALPILEAMRRGVPVACSNATVLVEAAGDAAELFDPRDVGAIAAAIRRLLDDRERREELIARGRLRYPLFKWEKTAQATLDVYRDVLAGRSASRTSHQ